MLDRLFAAANWRAALIALVVLFASSYLLGKYSPKNVIAQDLKGAYISTDNPYQTERTLWYDTARVTAMLGKYNEPEHLPKLYDEHEKFILRYDLVYPPCYAIPCVLLLAFFYPWNGGPRWLVLLPLAAAVFDYAENFSMLFFIRGFRETPERPPLGLLELSRACTFAKLSLLLGSVAFLLLFVFVGAHLRRRTSAP
jgi:hypothetical protein